MKTSLKRILLLSAVLLAATPALLAQSRLPFDPSTYFSFGKGPVTAQVLSYVGFGYHLPTNAMEDKQRRAFNDEFFLNILEIRAEIIDGGLLTLGIDWDWDGYRVRNDCRWEPVDGNSRVIIVPRGEYTIRKSVLAVNTFSVPLGFEYKIEKWAFRFDAGLDLNLRAKTRLRTLSSNGDITRTVVKGIPTHTLNYHFTAAISYGGLGLYARFNPMSQFDPGVGPQYRAITLGLILGLGM